MRLSLPVMALTAILTLFITKYRHVILGHCLFGSLLLRLEEPIEKNTAALFEEHASERKKKKPRTKL
jgi:hypothetical protein